MQKRYNIKTISREEYLKNWQDIFQVFIDSAIAPVKPGNIPPQKGLM